MAGYLRIRCQLQRRSQFLIGFRDHDQPIYVSGDQLIERAGMALAVFTQDCEPKPLSESDFIVECVGDIERVGVDGLGDCGPPRLGLSPSSGFGAS